MLFKHQNITVFCRPLDRERVAPLKTADDSLANLVPGLRRLGSSIALLGIKSSAVSQASRQ